MLKKIEIEEYYDSEPLSFLFFSFYKTFSNVYRFCQKLKIIIVKV